MRKFLTIILLLISCIVNAQWVQMSNHIDTVSAYALVSNGNSIFAGAHNGFYVSTNNDTIWTYNSLTDRWILSLLQYGNNTIAGTLRHGVYRSTNNGMNWTQSAWNNGTVYCLAINGNYIFAGTNDSGVYVSSDNGINWARTSLNNKDVNSFAISNNSIFAATSWSGIYVSTNNGTNWTQTSFTMNEVVNSLSTGGNNIYAGTGHGVYRSTNNGTNWTRTLLDTNTMVFSLAAGTNYIIAGTYFGLYLSTNNGTNWTGINQGLTGIPTIYAILIANNFIYAGLYGQFVWRRPLSEILGVQNINTEVPSAYLLGQNFPNPFNPTTKIEFNVSRPGDVRIAVYDIMGREVQTLVNVRLQPGTYETTFDGSGLNSGVYFYKMTSGGFNEIKKMVLLK